MEHLQKPWRLPWIRRWNCHDCPWRNYTAASCSPCLLLLLLLLEFWMSDRHNCQRIYAAFLSTWEWDSVAIEQSSSTAVALQEANVGTKNKTSSWAITMDARTGNQPIKIRWCVVFVENSDRLFSFLMVSRFFVFCSSDFRFQNNYRYKVPPARQNMAFASDARAGQRNSSFIKIAFFDPATSAFDLKQCGVCC